MCWEESPPFLSPGAGQVHARIYAPHHEALVDVGKCAPQQPPERERGGGGGSALECAGRQTNGCVGKRENPLPRVFAEPTFRAPQVQQHPRQGSAGGAGDAESGAQMWRPATPGDGEFSTLLTVLAPVSSLWLVLLGSILERRDGRAAVRRHTHASSNWVRTRRRAGAAPVFGRRVFGSVANPAGRVPWSADLDDVASVCMYVGGEVAR